MWSAQEKKCFCTAGSDPGRPEERWGAGVMPCTFMKRWCPYTQTGPPESQVSRAESAL